MDKCTGILTTATTAAATINNIFLLALATILEREREREEVFFVRLLDLIFDITTIITITSFVFHYLFVYQMYVMLQ